MFEDKDYVKVHLHETYIGKKPLGVKIYVAIGREITEEEKNVIWRQGDIIFNGLWKGHVLQDQDIVITAKEKEDILNLFGDKLIFVEEIPNGYCNQSCCINKPWFIVTTSIGQIKIGWRKRVINIDWSKTTVKETAITLFPNEDTTKGEQYIHAWGYEKAKEYLNIIHKDVVNELAIHNA